MPTMSDHWEFKTHIGGQRLFYTLVKVPFGWWLKDGIRPWYRSFFQSEMEASAWVHADAKSKGALEWMKSTD